MSICIQVSPVGEVPVPAFARRPSSAFAPIRLPRGQPLFTVSCHSLHIAVVITFQSIFVTHLNVHKMLRIICTVVTVITSLKGRCILYSC